MRPTHPLSKTPLGVAGAVGLCWAVASPAHAQQQIPNTPYVAFVESNHTFQPLQNPTAAVTTSSYFRNYSASVQLPFPFEYYEESPVNQVTISAGVVFMENFGGTPWYFNRGYGSGSPNRYIAPYWDYIEYAQSGAGALYEVIGRAPRRQFAIEWRNGRNGLSNSGNYNFQVRLHEGLSGRIDVIYGPSTGARNEYGYTMAMEDGAGQNIITFSNCSTNCSFSNFSPLIGRRITLVQDPGVELVGLGLTPPQFATLGVPVQIPVSIANAHRNPLGPFAVRILASRTRDGANATEIGRTTVALSPFQTTTVQVDATPGAALGENSYFLFAEVDADNEVSEVNENNNRIRSGSQVRLLPSRPDLRVDRVDLSTRNVDAGGTVDVTVSVTNAGSEPVNAADVTAMLSSNPVISGNDGVLDSTTVTLAASTSTTVTFSVTLRPGTNSGSYYIGALADQMGAIDEINESNNGLSAIRPVDVQGGSVAILTSSLPQALVGETYVALLRATGGSGDYNWEVTQGQLPQGLGIVQSTGEFFGRPSGMGCESFTVTLTDAQDSSQTASQMLMLCVTSPTEPLTVVTRAVRPAVAGQEYSFQLVATGGMGGGAPTWSASGLPSGFMVTSSGMLVGRGEMETSTQIEVTVMNEMESASRQLDFEVLASGNLQIVPTPPDNAQIGQPYTFQFRSTGGIEPITWTNSLDQLDGTGLELSPSGELSGVPTRAGLITFTVEARDSGPIGRAARDENTFQLLVADDDALRITTETLPSGNVGDGYDAFVAAEGGVPPYTWEITPEDPVRGLSVQTENRVTNELAIAGTPEEVASVTVLVRAIDQEGRTTERAFRLEVGPEIQEPDPAAEDDDGGCTATHMGGSTSSAASSLVVLLGFALMLARRRR